MQNRRGVNLLFGVLIATLGATALFFMYLNRNRPTVIEAAPVTETAQLPEGHPPLDTADRVQALEKLSLGDPQNPDYKIQIGNAYYDLGQYQKAIDAYQQALKLRPNDAGVETDMGTCYHYLGQSDQALDVFNRVLGYRPNFPQALFNKGIALLEGKKDARAAIAAWEELVKSNPEFPQRAQVEQRIRQIKAAGTF
jgi:tetratricopeptide (TPR) repeat protein